MRCWHATSYATLFLVSLLRPPLCGAQSTCGDWMTGPLSGFAPDGPVLALHVHDDGSGPRLFAGGDFVSAGGAELNHVASWDGRAWRSLGGGTDGRVTSLATFDDGTGPALYAGGTFSAAGGVSARLVARWDGESWTALGGGLAGETVECLAVFDPGDGPSLYVGGWINSAEGQPALQVARWDGASWHGLRRGLNSLVRTMVVHDDGRGAALFLGGAFTSTIERERVNFVARWDGSAFEPLGAGFEWIVHSLAVHDSGAGPALFAAGDFTRADGYPARRVAVWEGGVWREVGGGVDGSALALASFDDGNGPALFVGGSFNAAAGVTAYSVARWNGRDWASLGAGTDPFVRAFAAYDGDGSGPVLFAGGAFRGAGTLAGPHLAIWRDPCAESRRGNVNAGAGRVADVLFVNDSAGGALRRVVAATHEPFNVFVAAPPAATEPAPFALYAWAETPRAGRERALPFGLGLSALPMPVTEAAPSLRAIWNNAGREALGAATRYSLPAPSLVASRPTGVRRPMTFFLQGIVADRASAARRPASVTNGVEVQIR